MSTKAGLKHYSGDKPVLHLTYRRTWQRSLQIALEILGGTAQCLILGLKHATVVADFFSKQYGRKY